jgi:hypothetical protein
MKVRVTIVKEYTLQRTNYRFDNVADRERTDEELNALTATEMMNIDEAALKEGDIGLDELLDLSDTLDYDNEDQIKWEVVSD